MSTSPARSCTRRTDRSSPTGGRTPRTVAARPTDTIPAGPAAAKTQPGPATASRTPGARLDATAPALSTQPATALVAVSSSALRTRAGTTTACAGRVVATATEARTAAAYAAGAASSAIAAAVASMPRTWTR